MENFSCIQDFENHALRVLQPDVKSYYLGSADAQSSTKFNTEAFRELKIRPKLLRDVSKRDISTTILGEKVSMPLGISPTAHQKSAHPDGELANAKAAESVGTIFILSSYANHDIEEVARAAPQAIKWQQLTVHKDRDSMLHAIRKAESAGFKAFVVAVDLPILPKTKVMKDLMTDSTTFRIYEDYYSSKFSTTETIDQDDYYNWLVENIDDSTTWRDISWLKSITTLPIVVKGVLTAEDAVLAVDHGASGILVSNHGGRQLPSTPTTIEALPEIVAAVGDQVEVYVDGGIRQGTDVFKALALGAKMVFVGRPMLWGLVCGGEKGARAVLNVFRNEIAETFAMAGCRNVQEITTDFVKHKSLFSHL